MDCFILTPCVRLKKNTTVYWKVDHWQGKLSNINCARVIPVDMKCCLCTLPALDPHTKCPKFCSTSSMTFRCSSARMNDNFNVRHQLGKHKRWSMPGKVRPCFSFAQLYTQCWHQLDNEPFDIRLLTLLKRHSFVHDLCSLSVSTKCMKCKEGTAVLIIRAGDAFCR